jgi:hypothetical protein
MEYGLWSMELREIPYLLSPISHLPSPIFPKPEILVADRDNNNDL